ncbi:MAG TPA: metallophosphoesterase, partial [Acidimicrobiia bacterium]|nr:metallophosphoesterase [Acidimicrobiia bacterium]
MPKRSRSLRVVLAAAFVLASTLFSSGLPAARADVPPASFTFGAAGDFGAGTNAAATLSTLGGAGTDLFFAVGDLGYSEVKPESAWCDFVKARVGAGYPFEIVSGNHEDNGPDGLVTNFAACLPDRVGNASGRYGKEYFVDYPPAAPLARFIMISPALTFPGESTYAYTVGSAHYTWLANAIDSARAAGVKWVIVGMHEVCLSAGSMSCTIGTDLLNLLVGKKVDLVLQGHEHSYQRSKQLALGSACTAVTPGSYKAGCVVDDGSDGNYTKGAGPVIMIAGTGGEGMASVSSSDSDGRYFAKLMGSNANPTTGFVRYQVTADQISAQFVRSARGTFTDSFTITSGGAVNSPPSATATSAATTADTAVPVTLAGADPETCELGFSLGTAAHGTLS